MSGHKRSNVSKIFGNGMIICAEDNDSTDVDRGDVSNNKNQISCALKDETITKPTNSSSMIEFPLADKASQSRRLEANTQTGNDKTTTNENKLLCPDHQVSRLLFADRLNYGSFQEECIHFARTSSLSTALPMQQLRKEFLLRESTGDVDLNWLRSKEYYKQRQSGKEKYNNITQADRLAVNRHHDFKRKYRLDKDGLNDPSSSLQPDVKFFSVVEFGRNNSNGAREHRSNGGISGRVIRVQGDGRCLFRSLITCLSPDLQKTRRDDFGTPLRREDITFETHMSDALRAKVVKLMFDNAHFYGQLDQTVLNADVPVPTGYSHFRERLSDMTLTSTMPGDLELNATSSALERQVLVLNADLKPIVAYGKDRYPQSEVVAVRFTRLGPDVGHYDAVIPDLMAFSALDLDSKHGDTKRESVEDIKQYDTPYLMDCFKDLLLKSKNNSNDQMEYSSPNKLVDKSTQASQTQGEETSCFGNNKSQNATNTADMSEPKEKPVSKDNASASNQYEDLLGDLEDVYFFAVKNEDETEMDYETAIYILTEKGEEKSRLKKNGVKKTQKGPDSKANCHLNTCDGEIDRTMKRVDSKKMARVKRITKCRSGKTPKPEKQTRGRQTKKQTSLVQKWLKKRNKLDLKRIGESTTCFLCNKPMSPTQTSMAVCTLCGRVAHTQCVQPAHWGLVGGSRDGYFVCPRCLPASQA